jgi:hypothetical protein
VVGLEGFGILITDQVPFATITDTELHR